MSNILLVNDNVQDYQKIINACNDSTYAITYNQQTDTYETIITKYENLVAENNIQVLNHLALVSHGINNPEFTFLEKENKMLISHYFEDLSTSPSENEKYVRDASIEGKEATAEEEFLIWNSDDSLPVVEPKDISSELPLNKLIINNLDTWVTFKEFIKKFNIQISLDFLGCALLQSTNWKYVLEKLETEQHLNLTMRASDDNTGNLKVGGDWVLESDNVNIKELYFNSESIEKWNYTLNTYNFTNLNGGATYIGPTSAGISGYNGTNLQGDVTISSSPPGIQEWTVPVTSTYTIEAWGASGGDGTQAGQGHGSGYQSNPDRYGGVGRNVKVTVSLTQGTVIYILVGQGGHRNYSRCGGGGGGTFVTTAKGGGAVTSDILVIAGGGGGGGRGYGSSPGQSPEINARDVNSVGGISYDYHTSGKTNLGGTGGGGGQYAVNSTRKTQGSTGGGGFIGDGTIGYSSRTSDVGKSFRNGGQGGQASVNGTDYGGFGGGGSQPHQNHVGGGGGGGYNGGAPGGNYHGAWSGGGGSSYASVTPDHDIEWAHSRTALASSGGGAGRHGKVTITEFDPVDPIPTSNISLSILKAKYVEYDALSGEGNSYLRDSSTTSTINLSYFNGVMLSDRSLIQGAISFSQFSGEELLQGYDYPIFIFSTSFRSQTSFSIDSTSSYGANKKVSLITSGQTSYGNILPIVNGVDGDNAPSIPPTKDYNIWLKLTANSVGDYMIGLINRESWRTSWTSCVSDNYKIKSQHATYADRIMFHSSGFFTYSGNYKPSGTDPVLGTSYSGLGSIFYNKMGSTAGSGGVTSSGQTFNLDNSQNFKTSDYISYANSIAINDHIGIRVKYFTATITATVTNSQNYVVISSQNLDNVFTGMRVSGTSIPTNSVLGDVHTNRLYLRDEYTGSLKNASGTTGTYTLTLSGQLMQFRKSNSSFNSDLLFGPPHIVLPLKYSTVLNNTSPNGDITDWSMIIGDTSGLNNSQWTFEIIDDKPVTPEPSWSYTYSDWSVATGIDATTSFREISNRVIIDGSVSDYTGAWDVSSIQVNAVGSKRIYIALKVTASTTYFNDICIAGVQRISASGTVLNSWIFNTSSGGTGSTWQTTRISNGGSSTILSNTYSPITASTKSYYSISLGTSRDRMNWSSATGSSYTGAAGGILTGSYGSAQFPTGNGTISQNGSTYYGYREVSGSARYSSTFFRSPAVTFNGTDTIKVVHLITTRTGQPVSASDSIWLAVY